MDSLVGCSEQSWRQSLVQSSYHTAGFREGNPERNEKKSDYIRLFILKDFQTLLKPSHESQNKMLIFSFHIFQYELVFGISLLYHFLTY